MECLIQTPIGRDDTVPMGATEVQAALDSIVHMLRQSDHDDQRLFPPTELYSEGWMLRLVLSAAQRGVDCLPVTFARGARWYSEARLESPFMRRPESCGNHLAEGFTRADAILGHFRFRDHTQAGIELVGDATQFVVIEAKMFSALSSGTTNAPHYDQAARSVACMARVLGQSSRDPRDMDSLAFYVLAPRRQLERDPSFHEWTTTEGISRKVEQRVSDFRCDPHRREELERWLVETFAPMMEQLEVACMPWEDLLERIPDRAQDDRDALRAFYRRCLRHNQRLESPS